MRKRLISKIAAAISGAACALTVSASAGLTAFAAVDVVSREYYELPGAGVGTAGIMEKDGRMFSYGNGETAVFSGIMSVGGETYCYVEGCKWFGWKKIGDNWYYFDPADNGNMAKEKAQTALGTYYFNESGAWDGRYTSKAKAPADFVFSLGVYSYGSWLTIDSGTGVLSNGESGIEGLSEGYFDRSIKAGVKDRQIIYDTLMSCGIDKITAPVTGAAVNPGAAVNTDITRYEVKFTAGGKSYSVDGDQAAFAKYGENKEVNDFAYVTAFLTEYVKSLPAYRETETAKLEANQLQREANFIDPIIFINK
ncbi:MAG: hypothetical protein K2K57_11015 [Oscillospiraceae bacterium]|nr:hypothetical protein [Oscillospiraceae bacterium]